MPSDTEQQRQTAGPVQIAAFDFARRRSGRRKSVTTAVAVEFMLVEMVDWAAAKMPATIRPAMPTGTSSAMNSGKIWSVMKVGSSFSGLDL